MFTLITKLVFAHLLLFSAYSINVMLDPCLSKECPTGSSCRVFEVTGEAFCEPSCELENGGCENLQKCELVNVTCSRAPCPPVVNCRGNYSMVYHTTLNRNMKVAKSFSISNNITFDILQWCVMDTFFMKTTPILRAIDSSSQGLH